MAAQAAYFQAKDDAVFSAADYGLDLVELWPENWRAWRIFCQVSTQWRVGTAGPTGLDYGGVFPLLDRIASSDEEWLELFEDIQTLESAALEQLRENARD